MAMKDGCHIFGSTTKLERRLQFDHHTELQEESVYVDTKQGKHTSDVTHPLCIGYSKEVARVVGHECGSQPETLR
jgi:hypothetical protein